MCKNLNAAYKGYRGAFTPSSRQNAWNCALFYTKKHNSMNAVLLTFQQPLPFSPVYSDTLIIEIA